MWRPIAHIPLQPYIAPLPARVSVSKEGIIGELGGDKKDLSRSAEPIHVVFANWHSNPEDILQFTRKYGLLLNCREVVTSLPHEYADPEISVGQRFSFSPAEWIRWQQKVQAWWRFQLGRKPFTPAPAGGGLADRVSDALAELGHLGFEKEAKTRPERAKSFLDDINDLLSVDPNEPYPQDVPGIKTTIDKRGRIQMVLTVPDLLTYIILLMLREKPAMLRVCANVRCSAPYFVAGRKDQKYCGSDCSQNVASRNWWKKHGKKYRSERKKKTRKRRG